MVVASRTAVAVRSVDEVVDLVKEPKIAKLQKDGGEMNTALVIEVMLSKMADDMHLRDGMTESNIDEIVKRLTTDDDVRHWLTLADISLLCRRIAEGYYGKTYGRFGLAEFNECLVAYCNERRDCHRQQNDKVVVKPQEATLTMEELGYTIGEDGHLIVSDKGLQKKRPMRYLYDEKCNIMRENPAYWGRVREGKSEEELEKMNRQNKVMELVHELMKADPGIGYVNAVEMATKEINQPTNTSNQ